MTVKLYDLVPHKGINAPLFSPATVRARLALVHKRVPFETVEVTYHDLRFYWTPRLGVSKATAPLLELVDGTIVMDSLKIIEWLDKTYPDRPSLYLPETVPPIDVESAAYRSAIDDFERWRQALTIPQPLFAVYAPMVVPKFDEETAAYWTNDERLGQKGTWEAIKSRDPKEALAALKLAVKQQDETLRPDWLFLSSATAPGVKDISLIGMHRMLRSNSAAITAETFEGTKHGEILSRLLEYFHEGLAAVEARDPK